MGLKNKAQLSDIRKAGTFQFNGSFFSDPEMNPLKFANSSELRKIQMRNKKKRK